MTGKKYAVIAKAFGRSYVWVFDTDAEASEYFRRAFEFYNKRRTNAAWQVIEVEEPESFDDMSPWDHDCQVR